MSADPRPKYKIHEAIATNELGQNAYVSVAAHRNDSGYCARLPATVNLEAYAVPVRLTFPRMLPEQAREIARLLCVAADTADSLDAWHERHPECVGVAS